MKKRTTSSCRTGGCTRSRGTCAIWDTRGKIQVVAKGESERFPVDDPGAYTRAQRWQMDRRVELIR